MTHPNLIMAAWLISGNLILYFWMRRAKRKRQQEQRERIMRRLLEATPIDCFPRERYTLSPLDIAIVKDLVDNQ